MAKLADALASGASGRKAMGVQVPLRAQTEKPSFVDGFSVLYLLNGSGGQVEPVAQSVTGEIPPFFGRIPL
jgi:hypothetical protein